jgi:hypothetical protein
MLWTYPASNKLLPDGLVDGEPFFVSRRDHETVPVRLVGGQVLGCNCLVAASRILDFGGTLLFDE